MAVLQKMETRKATPVSFLECIFYQSSDVYEEPDAPLCG
jgi:hypothetical protein